MKKELRDALKEKAELISVRAQQIAAHSGEYLDYEVADRMREIKEQAESAFEMCPAKKSDDHKGHLPKESEALKAEESEISKKELPSGNAKQSKSDSSNGVKRQ